MPKVDLLINNNIKVISTFLGNYKFTMLVSHPITIAIVALLLLQLSCFWAKNRSRTVTYTNITIETDKSLSICYCHQMYLPLFIHLLLKQPYTLILH
jgi:hypothetical protein